MTRGYPVLKPPARPHPHRGQGGLVEDTQTVLYDLKKDPGQTNPSMMSLSCLGCSARHSPPEAYERINLMAPGVPQVKRG